MKKTVSLLLAILCITSIFSLCTVASAANTGYKQLNTCSSAYAADGTLRGQTMLEKCITVKRGEKWVVCPQLSTGARQNKSLASEVRFAVWVYDCSTGKRVKTVNLKDGESYQLPTSLTSNKTYSVQVRPYMSATVWNRASRSLVNAYLYSAASMFRLQYNKK